ncbi:MAG TPA: hypothetical protein VGA78_07035 [Gemmatimonadales bacterium]
MRFSITILLAAVASCSETTAPLPPPQELLLVANPGFETLSYVQLSQGVGITQIPLGHAVPEDARPAAGRRFAILAVARGDTVAVVDLIRRRVSRTIAVGEGAGALGGLVFNDSIAYVALSGRDALMRLNLESGDTLSIAVGHTPKAVAIARGKLFVVNANLVECPPPDGWCPAGESWVTVVDPITNTRAAPGDSIALPGPGHARYATIGADGRLYVIQMGGPASPEGRLSIVDPVLRAEVGNFGGFGEAPGPIAADAGERIMVSSRTEGLMEFNTRTRTLIRGAGNGLPLSENVGVAIDTRNQIYGIEAGHCGGGLPGRARVFRQDLTEIRPITLGPCAGVATTALIPPETLLEAT